MLFFTIQHYLLLSAIYFKIDYYSFNETIMEIQDIHIAEGVTKYVQRFIAPDKKGKIKARVELKTGGCSGHKYFLSPVEEVYDEDLVITQDGVEFYFDSMLIEFFHGLEITYEEDLNGVRIKIKNPSAKGGCSCGASVKL